MLQKGSYCYISYDDIPISSIDYYGHIFDMYSKVLHFYVFHRDGKKFIIFGKSKKWQNGCTAFEIRDMLFSRPYDELANILYEMLVIKCLSYSQISAFMATYKPLPY